jgi:hypothetical protein
MLPEDMCKNAHGILLLFGKNCKQFYKKDKGMNMLQQIHTMEIAQQWENVN